MKSNIIALIVLVMLFITSPLSAVADSFHDIAIQARAMYTAAQEKWQNGLFDLTVRMNSDFREVATVNRDLQLAYIKEGTVQFRYLLEHDPHRIVLTNGISQFANFAWTDADTKALAKSDPAYAQLQKRIVALEKKNDGEPDWPNFRAWFHDTLSQSSDYKSLLSDFQAKQKAVEALLKKYKPAQCGTLPKIPGFTVCKK